MLMRRVHLMMGLFATPLLLMRGHALLDHEWRGRLTGIVHAWPEIWLRRRWHIRVIWGPLLRSLIVSQEDVQSLQLSLMIARSIVGAFTFLVRCLRFLRRGDHRVVTGHIHIVARNSTWHLAHWWGCLPRGDILSDNLRLRPLALGPILRLLLL
jgi:hypothetical protein